MEPQTFWEKNQVLIAGIAGALVLALQQFITEPTIDWKVIGLAALLGIAGYLANEWRGKGVTVAGFIGVVANAFVSIQATGGFTWNQFILSIVIGFLALVAPPPKSIGYEKSSLIQSAKAEGENREPSTTPPNPPMK